MLERCKKGSRWSGGTKVEKLHHYPLKKDESEFEKKYPRTADINNESVRIRVLISSPIQNRVLIKHIEEKVKDAPKLFGWAQTLNGDNEPIEAVFQGTSGDVEAMIGLCKKGDGSSEEAKVKELHRYPLKDDENSFKIIREEKEIKGD
jgi:acylphosphatase